MAAVPHKMVGLESCRITEVSLCVCVFCINGGDVYMCSHQLFEYGCPGA